MRGEHVLPLSPSMKHWGSSPLARGAHTGCGARWFRMGIIPACAGSTARSRRGDTCRRDHPRLRGEHIMVAGFDSHMAGSSPLARGARRGLTSPHRSPGIIPACAGSTSPPRRTGTRWRDHPRLRGEHPRPACGEHELVGSSPLARGARDLHASVRQCDGIIPACAGSTLRGERHRLIFRDHPRLRGEHFSLVPGSTVLLGSSPLARGAHFNTSNSSSFNSSLCSLFH